MSIKLSGEELNDFLSSGHTLILSTIRQSGEPFTTPIWYVYADGAFYIKTPAKSPKVQHLQRDPRACCVVEAGKHWQELRAVVASCSAEFIEDRDEMRRIQQLMDDKYASFRPATPNMPESSKKAYSTTFSFIKLTPRDNEIRSWDNRKIQNKKSA